MVISSLSTLIFSPLTSFVVTIREYEPASKEESTVPKLNEFSDKFSTTIALLKVMVKFAELTFAQESVLDSTSKLKSSAKSFGIYPKYKIVSVASELSKYPLPTLTIFKVYLPSSVS